MSFAILRLVFAVAFTLMITRACIGGLWRWENRYGSLPSAKPWLHAGCALVAASVTFPLVMLLVGADVFFLAPLEFGHHPYSGKLQLGLRPDVIVNNPVTDSAMAIPAIDGAWTERLVLAAVVLAVFGTVRLLLQAVRLARTCDAARTWKKIGPVRIAICAVSMVPFCTWTFRGWVVVVPPAALEYKDRLRLIVAHEFAHIRNKHLHTSWLLAGLAALTPWNPAVVWWQRWIARVQEIACDQYVLARKSTDRISYGRCLLWAAQASSTAGPQVLALSMAAGSSGALKERFTMILSGRTRLKNRAPLAAVGGSILAALVGLGVQGFAADHRLSLVEAQAIADRSLAPFGVAVTIDELALHGLNRIMTGGRRSFGEAIRRLDAYRKIAAPVLSKHGVPEPLLGIALAESGIDAGLAHQHVVSPGDAGPRGIWQMTAQTARTMGLRVDTKLDERFDQAREVEAVARLLAYLHQRLSDWNLAIAAYNMGLQKVETAVKDGGTANPRTLREKGLLNSYLAATVVPAMLVAQEPQLVMVGMSREPSGGNSAP